jgi:predicted nucleic acid-binding protein
LARDYLEVENRMPVVNCRACYFDASALVKLVADDDDEKDGREAVRNLYWNNANMYATSYCVTEALGVFKRKFNHKKIGQDDYVRYCMDFAKKILGGNLHIDEVSIVSLPVFQDAERLITKHGIDFIDCLQLVTLLRGKFNIMIDQSRSLLVTADEALARAARAEGASVWQCRTEAFPNNA